jgi:rare lipoprotein A
MRILFSLLFFLLASCQTQHVVESHHEKRDKKPLHVKKIVKKDTSDEKDGAPSGPLPSWFKKVIPTHLPLSRYGNPAVYHVNGHVYDVMTSSSGYHARGIASWYGTKFHSRRTSSGEPYDMYALTAAHKTLPIPCYVKVKNLNNGRVAIVKVNDRGPFHEGRVIDLSYAAAAKLGLFPKGTAPVEIEALTTTKAGKPHAAQYYLQAGAFNSRPLANALRAKLTRLTSSLVFIEQYQGRFLVRIGPFGNKGMIDRLKRTLSQQGVTGTFSLMM